jgi:hypothetical protein
MKFVKTTEHGDRSVGLLSTVDDIRECLKVTYGLKYDVLDFDFAEFMMSQLKANHTYILEGWSIFKDKKYPIISDIKNSKILEAENEIPSI